MAGLFEKWVEEQARLTLPDKIYWCDGSEEEARRLIDIGIKQEKINGNPVFSPLNHKNWPNSYFHRSHPTDVARTEHLTFVCSADPEQAGPNNNWMAPDGAKLRMSSLSAGCMKGRTMYVLPYMMGHPDSPYAKACIQITDSVYVAVSMRIMTRMGSFVRDRIGESDNFVKGFHSIGDLSPEKRFIMHFPEENFVWSVGSGYGGNALLGKKCFSLRIASSIGLREGWLAEHMLIIGVEDPQGNITYIAAAFPSACGKTNLAMLESTLPGYKVWTLGDDIAWLNIGEDGRLWAINPEAGLFGVAPGTSARTNPNMLGTLKKGTFFPTLFTNTAIDLDKNEPWWEGLSDNIPGHLSDWQGKPWDKSMGTKAAHPNARFTVALSQSPNLSKEHDNPRGVPISAVIFGCRRTQLIPMIVESFNWQHGVFSGARMGSETTAAAAHKTGVLRRDPMAMLPFCGYNMGDYFRHWLDIGARLKNPPKIFSVNWFRVDDEGGFIWPGFGDNIRILKWIIERAGNKASASETIMGLIPRLKDLDLAGLSIKEEEMSKLFKVDKNGWKEEVIGVKKFFSGFGAHLPRELNEECVKLERQLL